MEALANTLKDKLVLESKPQTMATSSKSSPDAAKVTPEKGLPSPFKTPEENVVLVSPQGVKTIYEDVITKLNRLEQHATSFISKMYEMNLGSEMKQALTSDPPAVEMLLLFEKIAANFSPNKRTREFTGESNYKARQTAKFRPKRPGNLKGKRLLVPKVESSSSGDFASPPRKIRAFKEDSSLEIL